MIQQAKRNDPGNHNVCFKLVVVLMTALIWSGVVLPNQANRLLATTEIEGQDQVRVYSFKEVGDIAQNNGLEISKQKANLEQAELKKEETGTSYQIAAFEYWYQGGTGDESTAAYSQLYSLQAGYENAVDSATDAEESLEKLKPKVRYDAQRLYISLLMGEKSIALQNKEIELLQLNYDLEKVKLSFGKSTQFKVDDVNMQLMDAEKKLASLISEQQANENTMRLYLDLPEAVPFELEPTPDLGQYKSSFLADEVRTKALENSMALKQAKKKLAQIDEQMDDYNRMGKSGQADQLAVSGTSAQISLEETLSSLKSKINSTIENLATAESNISVLNKKYERSQIDYITNKMKYQMGQLTKTALLSSENSLAAAADSYEQAQYDYYLAIQKVLLLEQGIL